MAKIVYGVAGQGLGHSSRAHTIAQNLIDAGHQLIFITSEKSYDYLQLYFDNQVKQIAGLFFIYKNRHLSPFKTFLANTVKLPTTILNNFKLFKEVLTPFQPDLVITDFEPFVSLWAQLNKVPLLSIDNEHLLTNCHLENLENNAFARFSSKFVIKSFHIKAAQHIILNFFETPVKDSTTILSPPLVRPILNQLHPMAGEHILYYSTDNTGLDNLLEICKKFHHHTFYIYGFNKSAHIENCILKKTSTSNFLEDLANARAVICTAGFSLISEAMHFRKKILLLPIAGQYEQLINAHYFQKLGLGSSSLNFTPDTLDNFLQSIDTPLTPSPKTIWPNNQEFFNLLHSTLNKMGITG